MERAEHPVAVGVKLSAVALDQAAKGRFIAATGRFQQRLLVSGRDSHRRLG
jgi:hypothetical protein